MRSTSSTSGAGLCARLSLYRLWLLWPHNWARGGIPGCSLQVKSAARFQGLLKVVEDIVDVFNAH